MGRRRGSCAFAALVFIVGCGEEGGGPAGPGPGGAALTYYRDVKPILEANCVSCHSAGGIAPFELTSYDDVYLRRQLVAFVVAERIMPPWPAADDCTEYTNDRGLEQAEIDAVVQWVDQGAREGRENDYVPVVPRQDPPVRADATLQVPAPYVPSRFPDDERCFEVEWTGTEEQVVTAYRVRPGNPEIVHHIIAILVPPELRDDGAAPLPPEGVPCGAGGFEIISERIRGADFATLTRALREGAGPFVVWAPGDNGARFPEGTGIRIRPGSQIILDVHYNASEPGAAPDQSIVELELEDSVAEPGTFLFWANPSGLNIPPGQSDVVQAFAADPTILFGGEGFRIHAAMLHMHLLGTEGRLVLDRRGGAPGECLLHIDRWDWNWQLAYQLAEPRDFVQGDQIMVECHYDNTVENQPVEHGITEPRHVTWGEGTTDEMCLGLMFITFP